MKRKIYSVLSKTFLFSSIIIFVYIFIGNAAVISGIGNISISEAISRWMYAPLVMVFFGLGLLFGGLSIKAKFNNRRKQSYRYKNLFRSCMDNHDEQTRLFNEQTRLFNEQFQRDQQEHIRMHNEHVQMHEEQFQSFNDQFQHDTFDTMNSMNDNFGNFGGF